MTAPDPQTAYNAANAGQPIPGLDGTNAVINSWSAVQDFTGNWAVTTYNTITNLTSQLQGISS